MSDPDDPRRGDDPIDPDFLTNPDEGMTRRRLLRWGAGAVVVVGAGGAAAALLGGSDDAGTAASTNAAQAAPKRGGRLKVAFVGGGTTETLDPRAGLADVDLARAFNLYERLADVSGPKGELKLTLAETIEPLNNSTTDWIIRVRPDVEWHDGKTLGAEDVIYSLQTILNPKNALGGRSDISFIDPKGIKKVDARTVQLKFLQPIADPRPGFASRLVPIVQDGTKDFTHPIGTGPFTFTNWTAGERSVFTRFANYREEGLPYVDELEFIDIKDDTARLNALRSGQVHAMQSVALADLAGLKNDAKVKLLSCASGASIPLVMDCTKAPFTDKRVRTAFKLLVDREQMVQSVLGGYGRIGNDLFAPFDELYDANIPQREHDPEQAKSLLKAAGQSDLRITLDTSKVQTGYTESATAFAQQAKAAGIDVQVAVRPSDAYFTKYYMKVPFFNINWGYWPLDEQFALSCYSKASYNEQGYKDPSFDKLWQEARGTLDDGQRKEMYSELQQKLWDDGGYVVWGFQNFTDAYSDKTQGWVCSPARPLGFYSFKSVSLV